MAGTVPADAHVLRQVANRVLPAEVTLLVMYGSRARGEARQESDWDIAFEASGPFDEDRLLAALVEGLNADRIDLTNLDRAGALLRFRVARDGVSIVERTPGTFERFRIAATITWCDLAPVLEPVYEEMLESVSR